MTHLPSTYTSSSSYHTSYSSESSASSSRGSYGSSESSGYSESSSVLRKALDEMGLQRPPEDSTYVAKGVLPSSCQRRSIKVACKCLSFSVCYCPVGLYRSFQYCASCCILPSSCNWGLDEIGDFTFNRNGKLGRLRKKRAASLEATHYFKRVRLQTKDRTCLDGIVIVSKEVNAYSRTKRCLFYLGGNGTSYEDFLTPDSEPIRLASALGAWLVLINLRGVGASEGSPTREGLLADADVAIELIERDFDPEEIILYGHSLGGGILGELARSRRDKSTIRYVSVTDRSFSRLSDIGGCWINCLNWELNSKGGAGKRQHPHIVVQHPLDGIIDAPRGADLASSQARRKGVNSIKVVQLVDSLGTLPDSCHNRQLRPSERSLVVDHVNNAFIKIRSDRAEKAATKRKGKPRKKKGSSGRKKKSVTRYRSVNRKEVLGWAQREHGQESVTRLLQNERVALPTPCLLPGKYSQYKLQDGLRALACNNPWMVRITAVPACPCESAALPLALAVDSLCSCIGLVGAGGFFCMTKACGRGEKSSLNFWRLQKLASKNNLARLSWIFCDLWTVGCRVGCDILKITRSFSKQFS